MEQNPEGPPSPQVDQRPLKWSLQCSEHGIQIISGDSVQTWDEETSQILRSQGDLKEGESFATGDCPVCGSTLQASHYHEENNPTSEHKDPTS